MNYTPGQTLTAVNQKLKAIGLQEPVHEFERIKDTLVKDQEPVELVALEFYANYLEKKALFGDLITASEPVEMSQQDLMANKLASLAGQLQEKLGIESLQVGSTVFAPVSAEQMQHEASLLREIHENLKVVYETA